MKRIKGNGSGLYGLLLGSGVIVILGQGCTCESTITIVDGTVKSDLRPLLCPGGTDKDNDGYGQGCSAGQDCDDDDPSTHLSAPELCDGRDNDCDGDVDEGVLSACKTCGPCDVIGEQPFPTDKDTDPRLKEIDGVDLDPNGDLVLNSTQKDFNYMWIANNFDVAGVANGCRYSWEKGYKSSMNPRCRGTVSKIDTTNMKEVARYYTVACKPGSNPCTDINGTPLHLEDAHHPSRTAVDFNFDVWVANREFAGIPSVTKIANDLSDCKDRNGDGIIRTSKDLDGDGVITVDCNGDGLGDSASTKCSDPSKKPEFVGDDDECLLFTTSYGDLQDYGRSVCLDLGVDYGASNAWAGTNNHRENGKNLNRYYRIDGITGKLSGPYPIAENHHPYGCAVDSEGILWSTSNDGILEADGTTRHGGTIVYLDTNNPTQISPRLFHPWPNPHNAKPTQSGATDYVCGFYGITTDGANDVWLGGCYSGRSYRYRPKRVAGGNRFAELANGTWTAVVQPTTPWKEPALSRGIAADSRGKVWVAINEGYLWRIDVANLVDGQLNTQTESEGKTFFKTKGTGVIGAGVDFSGNIWGISYNNSQAWRLKVDANGDPLATPPGEKDTVPVGMNPYTYSDFTGYGLQNFTRPAGTYVYELQPCSAGKKATWLRVIWSATTPPNTSVAAQVRSGDAEDKLGAWSSPATASPLILDKTGPQPLTPNPSLLLQVKFTLKTNQKDVSPILEDFHVAYSCDPE